MHTQADTSYKRKTIQLKLPAGQENRFHDAASDGLEVVWDERQGRHAVAARDITPGEVSTSTAMALQLESLKANIIFLADTPTPLLLITRGLKLQVQVYPSSVTLCSSGNQPLIVFSYPLKDLRFASFAILFRPVASQIKNTVYGRKLIS